MNKKSKIITSVVSIVSVVSTLYFTGVDVGAVCKQMLNSVGIDLSGSASDPTGDLNEHGYVDLGLPSGTRWATCNIGASEPKEDGEYFAWGETKTKETYSWETYSYCNAKNDKITKYCDKTSFGERGFVDNIIFLEADDDVATANWGVGWRMPTKEEFDELRELCEWEPNSDGCYITGPNGNSIFLPYAGHREEDELERGCYYWSCSLDSGDQAWYLEIDSNADLCRVVSDDRYYGATIRPVAPGDKSRLVPSASVEAPMPVVDSDCSDSTRFIDSRDGNCYATVTIGSQTWMAENLRYEGDIPWGSIESGSTAYRYYPDNNKANVYKYGCLYNWWAIMDNASSSKANPSGVKGICPEGWHLPSNAEWDQLKDVMRHNDNDAVGAQLAGNADVWERTQHGAIYDSPLFGTSGFMVLPAGYFDEEYNGFGAYANFWSATESNSNYAYCYSIRHNSCGMGDSRTNKDEGFSVRCVKDK